MNVLYLNRYLNCPDEVLRKNYQTQENISRAKAEFFYKAKEQGITGFQLRLCLDRFYHSNRDKFKLILNIEESASS